MAPPYYPSTQGDNAVNEREDIGEVYEHTKELERVSYIQADIGEQTYLNRAVYIGGNSGNTADLNRKGSVTVDDVTIADKLKHSEFIELLKIFAHSKHLLFSSQELNKSDEKRKRTLLALLCNLNWRVKDCFLQARLIKCMDERLQMLKAYVDSD